MVTIEDKDAELGEDMFSALRDMTKSAISPSREDIDVL
jgi:hypothetical protein